MLNYVALSGLSGFELSGELCVVVSLLHQCPLVSVIVRSVLVRVGMYVCVRIDLLRHEFAELLQKDGVCLIQELLCPIDQFDVFAGFARLQQFAEHVQIALNGRSVVSHGLCDGCGVLSGTYFHDTHCLLISFFVRF